MADRNPEAAALQLPEGTVLVHIGPHKTGTTSLQAALYAARPSMLAQGVRHAGGTRNPARAVQAATGQASTYTDSPPPVREWRGLVREVLRARQPRVVISSEFLAHADAEAVRRIVRDLGPERVHVVVTLRPLSRIVPSMWQQNVKAGRRASLDTWVHRLFPAPGEKGVDGFWRLHRHDALIARWAEAVGRERVTVVVVDEADRELVLRKFEQLLALSPGTLALQPGLGNRSLSAEETEAVRAFNMAYHRMGLGKALHARVMRYGAAQYLCRLDPSAEHSPIRLPDWSLEPIAATQREMMAAIATSGVRVVGDLETLLSMPDPVGGAAAPLPEAVPPEVAARMAMGVLIASGRARDASTTVSDEDVVEAMSGVASRQLLAAIAARTRAAAAARRRYAGRAIRHARSRMPAIGRSQGGDRDAGGSGAALLPEGAILLHIGPPKTGTTAVQGAFHAGRDAAERQGVHYAGSRRHSIAAVQAVLGKRGFRTEGVPPLALWNRLLAEIRRSDASHIVLSSEFFADAPPDRIRAVVADLDPARVHVVVTMRPLARIIPSQWQQYVQSGIRAAYEPWLDAILNKPPGTVSPSFWHRHRDDQLIARWAEVVGPDRITAIAIDETDREMVLRVFEQLVGLRDGTLKLHHDVANRSLTMPEIEAVRALNTAFYGAGLKRTLHSAIVNFGATEYLKGAPPEPDAARVELPAWAAARTTEIAREIVDGVAASGVTVIGDLERLAVVVPGGGPSPGDRETRVPVTVAANLALGVLFATGLASPPSSDATPKAGQLTGLHLPPPMAEPIEIARIPTRRLARVLASRSRASVVARVQTGRNR